jgi:hypothetical protein
MSAPATVAAAGFFAATVTGGFSGPADVPHNANVRILGPV